MTSTTLSAFGEDASYFESYAGLQIHEDMIRDEVRTQAYRRAILDHKDYFKGKVVLDVGAGTGILSVFCAQAGAKKVYSVEASAIAVQTRLVVEANGFTDVIQVINDKVENIDLPEKVDIIVSEWMGYFLLYESMFESVIFARDKWLVEGGLMLPSKASLYLCAISDESFVRDRVDFWCDASKLYGVDLTCLMDMARQSSLKDVHVEWLEPEAVLSRPQKVKTVDCYTVDIESLRSTDASFNFTSMIDCSFTGFGAWFDVEFQRPRNYVDPFWKPLKLSTSPDLPPTHWKQTLFYSQHTVKIRQDDTIGGVVKLTCNNTFKRWINVEFEWDVVSRNGSIIAPANPNSSCTKSKENNYRDETINTVATDTIMVEENSVTKAKKQKTFSNSSSYVMKDS
eukprot:CFRG5935T1